MKCVVGTVYLFLSFTYALTSEYVYEFGYDVGSVVYVKDGVIPLFHQITKVDLPVPDGTDITYIKVTVDAITAPKVDYEAATRRITIKYSWSQISDSKYNVIVKGVLE